MLRPQQRQQPANLPFGTRSSHVDPVVRPVQWVRQENVVLLKPDLARGELELWAARLELIQIRPRDSQAVSRSRLIHPGGVQWSLF